MHEDVCPLCNREMDTEDSDLHHLVPKHKGGRKGEVVRIHRFCHSKIHSRFTNAELAKKFNSIEKLLDDEEIRNFVKWVSGKPSSFYMKNDQKKDRRGKS